MKRLRFLAFLVATLFIFACATAPIHANEHFDHIEATEEIILPIVDLPEVINRDDAISRGHVARLKNEETDMYSVIFRNEDGTKSLYMFSSPIKYEDEQGVVRDKSTTLSKSSKGYSLAQNDVQLSFSNSLNAGVDVSYNKNSLKITPITNVASMGLSESNTMRYSSAYGLNTVLTYTPLLSGYKSTIMLREYDGTNSFSYKITSNNLNPLKTNDGSITLADADGYEIFNLGTFVVTDANGSIYEDELTLTANTDNSYTVTATISEEFLTNENVAYPLAIESSLVLNTTSAIDDAVIYSSRQNRNYGTYKYHNIGYVDSTYGVGRLLVSFPGLANNATFNSIQYNQFRKAEFHMYTASAKNLPFDLHAYRSTVLWSESTVTWNSYHTTQDIDKLMHITSTPVYYSAALKTTMNLLGIVKEWKLEPQNLYNGICLCAHNEASNSTRLRDFCSTEYANANNGSMMPYLEIVYDTENYIQVNLTILLDSAFGNRCIEMFPNMSDRIERRVSLLMDPVVDFYKDEFGIELNYTLLMHPSNIEYSGCSQSWNPDNVCTCYSQCVIINGSSYTPQHHTHNDLAIDFVPSGNESTHINMMFFGHKTCTHNETTGYCPGNTVILGKASFFNSKCAIFNTAISSTVNDSQIIRTIIHELGHLYGTPDHCGDNYRPNGSSNYCIWGEYDENIDRICSYCRNEIHTRIYRYQHG